MAQQTATETTTGNQKSLQGVVVSNKMEQTVSVAVTRLVKHPMYGKYIHRTKKFLAHDAENACGIGDTVEITETRRISKRKAWTVNNIISRAK